MGYIHHTGKAQARAGTVDQYASRGGSAFADNSRALLVMQPHDESESNNFIMPPEINEIDVKEGRVSRLHVAKFSFGKREQNPFWVVRGGDDDPWRFDTYASPVLTALEKEQISNIKANAEKVKIRLAIWDYVKERLGDDYFSATDLADKTKILMDGKKITNARVKKAIKELEKSGCLRQADLPDDQPKQGGKTTYLYPVKSPD